MSEGKKKDKKEFPYKNLKSILGRYKVLEVAFTLLALCVLGKIVYTMTVKRNFWEEVNQRRVKENVPNPQRRGSIYSADGELLATSLPEYKVYMDFIVSDKDSALRYQGQYRRDSLFRENLDSMTWGLHRIFPDKSQGWFKEHLMEGFEQKKRYWLVYPGRISYLKYKDVLALPFFNRGKLISGIIGEEFKETKKPFGSLASRTIGDMYPGKDTARTGLELKYDSLLRGKPGITHREKVYNTYLAIEDAPPIDGADIVTTLNVKLQDYAEKQLVDKMKEVNAIHGVVLVMEVATGDVKAIVNMSKCEDGDYREIRNIAVSNLMEPGSVFKPMSFLVAFDDGKLKMTDHVDGNGGKKQMYGRWMKDWNWHKGGYGTLSTSQCLEYSSNIGVSTMIDRLYHSDPGKFVDGLYRIGIPEDLHLDIPGYAVPRIRRPKKDKSNWSNTALPWMSIGYETQVPPISVLNFYNGVANGGKMMRPRFVTCAMRDGEVVEEYPPVVIREKMCSQAALKNLQTCLRNVVKIGLGKKAGSKNFSVSGKTGTAQVWASGGFSLNYLISFAGYFPSENPQYSCMVCMIKHGTPASGGGMCGPVFSKVAEMVMSNAMKPDLAQATDTLHNLMPLVSYGNLLYANKVLEDLNLTNSEDWASGDVSVWGRAITTGKKVELKKEFVDDDIVPNVLGMGARDAVYLLERLGLRVSIQGFGTVKQQSLSFGHKIQKHEKIRLMLGMSGQPTEDFKVADIQPEETSTLNDSALKKAKEDSAANRKTKASDKKTSSVKDTAKAPSQKKKP